MYQYNGWCCTYESADAATILTRLQELNGDYPVSARRVNGSLHIAFSGNPNRDGGQVERLTSYLCGLGLKLHGCVYVNDANDPDRFLAFDVVKIVDDAIIEMEDGNFTPEETRRLFE